jgi:CheY-like chemotaxis protein
MGRALRVLVVDDCCENADALADMIRLWGHCCVVVNDGSRALADLDALRPDVVLLELGLARLAGYEVARQLPAERRFNGVLLIAVTEDGEWPARQATRAAGFDFHLVKPVNADFLRDLLTHWRTRIAQRGRQDAYGGGTTVFP